MDFSVMCNQIYILQIYFRVHMGIFTVHRTSKFLYFEQMLKTAKSIIIANSIEYI